MKKHILTTLLISTAIVYSAEWQTVSVDADGKPTGHGMNADSKATHVMRENEYPMTTVLPTVEYKFWKKVGNDWLEMTPAEKQVVIDAEKDQIADLEAMDEKMKIFLKALVICVNKRLPEGNKITVNELRAEARKLIEDGG